LYCEQITVPTLPKVCIISTLKLFSFGHNRFSRNDILKFVTVVHLTRGSPNSCGCG